MPIELCHLSKRMDGKPVLRDLNHHFEDGSVTCIAGASGCGKTTLLRILLGLLPPDEGQIIHRPERCAAVFQENRLIECLSVQTNIRIALKKGFPHAEILKALEAVGLKEAADQAVCGLSGGMKRRVAIVRAMLSDAPVLLMDEPFTGLDRNTLLQTADFVHSRRAGRTAIIVTHDPSEAELLGAEIWKL